MNIKEIEGLVRENQALFDRVLKISGLKSRENSCYYASCFIGSFLDKFSNLENICICGGGTESGVKVNDEWKGHYWIEAEKDNNTYVIDITIDQFAPSIDYVFALKDSVFDLYGLLYLAQDKVDNISLACNEIGI